MKEFRDHINPSGPIHFVNTITTILAPTPDQSQQPTGNEGHGVKDETPEKDHEVAKSLADLFEDSITQEAGKLDESKERSKGHTKNPVILGESILEKLEENMVDITIGCSDRIKESDSEVFKISCTTRKKLITDTYIDPKLPINVIPLSLYNEAFHEQISCKGLDNARK